MSERKESRPSAGRRGDSDGVDGDVVKPNDRDGLFFDAAQVRQSQLRRRDARQKIRWLDDKTIVHAAQSRVRATGALEERHEGVREGRIRS